MTCYAIRHIPTGGYLPQREARGHTFEGPRVGCIPRLFARERSAKLALKAWLKGPWEPDYETDDWSGQNVKIGASAPATAPANRKSEDMAVVPIRIKEARR